MRIKVKVDGQFFEVEVGDLRERPIIAIVDGITFEVWPETLLAYTATATSRQRSIETLTILQAPSKSEAAITQESPATTRPSSVDGAIEALRTVKAPIPGVINAVLVQVGNVVTLGQELCKLEAMKINNSIRASHAGKIAAIHISIGQQVKHNDILMEFEE